MSPPHDPHYAHHPPPHHPPPPHHGPPPAPLPAGADWGFPAPSSETLAEVLGNSELGWQASLILRQAPAEIVVLAALVLARDIKQTSNGATPQAD